MEYYRTLRNLAISFLVMCMPYACNGCNYKEKNLNAQEIRTSEIQTEGLEKILN